MLIPARIGWTGSLGNTVSEVTEMIGRSVLADGTAPTGTVYYMQTNDVARSSPRHSLYPTAVDRVINLGGAAEHLFDPSRPFAQRPPASTLPESAGCSHSHGPRGSSAALALSPTSRSPAAPGGAP